MEIKKLLIIMSMVKFTYIGIAETCNGRQKTHKNYKFKYKND